MRGLTLLEQITPNQLHQNLVISLDINSDLAYLLPQSVKKFLYEGDPTMDFSCHKDLLDASLRHGKYVQFDDRLTWVSKERLPFSKADRLLDQPTYVNSMVDIRDQDGLDETIRRIIDRKTDKNRRWMQHL